MQNLKNLLARYAHVGVSERQKKSVVQNVLQDEFSITVQVSHIDIRENRVYVHVPASVRYVLHEEKKRVIAKINTLLGEQNHIVDIC